MKPMTIERTPEDVQRFSEDMQRIENNKLADAIVKLCHVQMEASSRGVSKASLQREARAIRNLLTVASGRKATDVEVSAIQSRIS